MSQENVNVVRESIESWNRDDLDAVLETLDPDVEPWKELRLDIERIEDGGDCVVMEFRFRAKGARSGAEVDLTFANAITMRNGLQTKIVARRVLEDARKAAGLSV
jgi:ketosteroid isomerase-like protein